MKELGSWTARPDCRLLQLMEKIFSAKLRTCTWGKRLACSKAISSHWALKPGLAEQKGRSVSPSRRSGELTERAKATAAAVAASYTAPATQFCECLWRVQKLNGEGKSTLLVVLCLSCSHLGHSQSQEALAPLPAKRHWLLCHPRKRV